MTPRSTRNGLIVLVAGLIVLVLFLAGWNDEDPRLIVREFDTGKTVAEVPVDYGQTVTMRYIHSVDKSPVFEVFRMEKHDGLILEETYFRMFGAGMAPWPGHGTLVSDGEWTRIREIHRPIGSFILRVGPKGIDHTLLVGKRTINLSETAAGHRVEISVSSH